VKGLIESKRGGDFNVKIAPVRKRVEFLPLEPKPIPSQYRPKFYILGIDPGTTAAICLMSLNGKVRMLKSKKGLTRADIIRMVYEKGIPVMVASDVPNAPHLVEKIASTVNAEVYTPRKPIPVATKQELAREYSEQIKIHNAHERDALTAAVYAYRSISPKLQQIDKKIRNEQIPVDRNHLKALVIKGTPINEAIASLSEEASEPVEVIQETVDEEPVTQELFDSLKKRYSALEEELQSRIVRIDDLERLVQYLRFRESELEHSIEIMNKENYWRVKRDREVAKKKSELRSAHNQTENLQEKIHELEERLDLLRGVKRLEMRGDTIAVKTVEKFTQESIEDYMKRVAHLKSGDIVLFEDASGGGPQTASLLIDREIKAVIVCTPLSHLAEEELVKAVIPVISADDVELRKIDEFAFINRKKFDAQMQAFLKEVQELARRKGEEQLIEIVERYRREIER
jgi:predicted RNase H-like nuclease (RuvC/YqgF family)